jgi:peptidoglycan glycosyltransferase
MLGNDGSRRPLAGPTVHVAVILSVAFALLAGAAGYWGVIRSADLVRSPDDAAVIAAARTVPRGRIVDRDGTVLARNKADANGELYRVYAGPAISQVVGYASRQYGEAGLERAYDAELSGLAGDPFTDAFAKFGADRYDPKDLTLSISYDLQKAAVSALGKRRGAIVMLDPRTGEVLALASTPTYDASRIANPATSQSAFASLKDDPAQPLLPRATLGRYVPGSVFKIVTAIAGLGSGAITPQTTYKQQPGAERSGLLVSGYRVHDGHHPQTGSKALDLVGATEVSCNIWYALTGLRTGGADLVGYAERMGFGAPLQFDLPTAVSQVTNGKGDQPGGFVDDVELANASYGQAETFVTPLQMALVAATVANDGELMRPRLVTAMTGKRNGTRTIGAESLGRVIPVGDAEAIKAAMVQAVEGRLGRLFTSGAKVSGVTTAGKSGTAELGGSGEPHSWFIGFAPAENPTVAIAVLVEQAGRGGEVAAPIAGRLMVRYLKGERRRPASRRGGSPARTPSAHRADRPGGHRARAGDALWRGRGRVLGGRRGLPRRYGGDRLPHDALGWGPDAHPGLMPPRKFTVHQHAANRSARSCVHAGIPGSRALVTVWGRGRRLAPSLASRQAGSLARNRPMLVRRRCPPNPGVPVRAVQRPSHERSAAAERPPDA